MQLLTRLPQIVLGLALGYAGAGHLGVNRVEFRAQVPSLLSEYADFVVLAWALLSTGAWRTARV